MLRKHAVKFGPQWDRYLPGVLWAYPNAPHETTREKPSFLMFGLDLRSPTEAALLPANSLEPSDVSDYREELVLSLSSARELAETNIREEQKRAKERYDKKVVVKEYKMGEWVLVRFPREESGKKRKLSKPWHGPYSIIQRNEPDVTVVPVHFPDGGSIQVHQSRVCSFPPRWPTGFYWYGGNKLSRGGVPKWVEKLLSCGPARLDDEISLSEGPGATCPPGEVASTEVIEDPPSQGDGNLPTEMTQVPSSDGRDSVWNGGHADLATSAPDRELPLNERYNLRRNVRPPSRFVE